MQYPALLTGQPLIFTKTIHYAGNFPNYAKNFTYYGGIMLYAFSVPIMLKIMPA